MAILFYFFLHFIILAVLDLQINDLIVVLKWTTVAGISLFGLMLNGFPFVDLVAVREPGHWKIVLVAFIFCFSRGSVVRSCFREVLEYFGNQVVVQVLLFFMYNDILDFRQINGMVMIVF